MRDTIINNSRPTILRQYVIAVLNKRQCFTSVTINFNREMDWNTASSSLFEMTGADGKKLFIQSLVPSLDGKTVPLVFKKPCMVHGRYSVKVSPLIQDTDGHRLNQDGDTIYGELKEDEYPEAFYYLHDTGQNLPCSQGFESGDIGILTGWSFIVNGGAWDVTSSDSLHGATYHLKATNSRNQHQKAGLLLDLTAQAGAESHWCESSLLMKEVSTVTERIAGLAGLTTTVTSMNTTNQRLNEMQPFHLALKHIVREALGIGFAIQKALSRVHGWWRFASAAAKRKALAILIQ